MRKSIISIAAALLLSSNLSAQEVEVKEGWQLLGAVDVISSMAHFKSGCVSIVWTYDESEGWKSYKPSLSSNALSSIAKGKGFWMKGESSECANIDFTQAVDDITDDVSNDVNINSIAQAVALAGDANGQTGDAMGDVSSASASAVSTVNSINRAIFREGGLTYQGNGVMSINVPLADGSSTDALVKFYDAASDEQITVDITDESNWAYPSGVLADYITVDMVAMEGYPDLSKMYMIIEAQMPERMEMPAGYVSLGKVTSEKTSLPSSPDEMPEKVIFNAEGLIEMSNGDSWSQRDMVINTYPNTPDVIDGSYEIYETIDGVIYTGTATYDQSGCKGATIKKDGVEVGTIYAEDAKLYLEVDGVKEEINFSDI